MPGLRYRSDFSFLIGQSPGDGPRLVPLRGLCAFDGCYGPDPHLAPGQALLHGQIQVDVPSPGQTGPAYPVPNRKDTWHAVFLVRNQAGDAVPVVMPFIRVFAIEGNTVTPAQHRADFEPDNAVPGLALPALSHDFPPGSLAGSLLIVLSGNGRGSVRRVTKSSDRTFTHDGAPLIPAAPGTPQDWMVLTPKGVAPGDFVYLGALFSASQGDVLNFYQDGRDYASFDDTTVLHQYAPPDFATRAPAWVSLAGHLPPTATRVRVYLTMINNPLIGPPINSLIAIHSDSAPHEVAQYVVSLGPDQSLLGISDTWPLGIGAGGNFQQSVWVDASNASRVLLELRILGFGE